jgi:hypothetical protein
MFVDRAPGSLDCETTGSQEAGYLLTSECESFTPAYESPASERFVSAMPPSLYVRHRESEA